MEFLLGLQAPGLHGLHFRIPIRVQFTKFPKLLLQPRQFRLVLVDATDVGQQARQNVNPAILKGLVLLFHCTQRGFLFRQIRTLAGQTILEKLVVLLWSQNNRLHLHLRHLVIVLLDLCRKFIAVLLQDTLPTLKIGHALVRVSQCA